MPTMTGRAMARLSLSAFHDTTMPPSQGGDPSLSYSQQGWTAERLSQASYKDLGSPESVEERFYLHLVTSPQCVEALRRLLRESSATTRDYSITVDAFDLLHADPVLGHLLLQYPATLLPLLERAVVRAQEDLLKQFRRAESSATADADTNNTTENTNMMMVKGGNMTRVHARLVHLPPTCFKPCLGGMSAGDVGKIVQVTGTVVRTSAVQMYESARTYRCSGTKGCGRTFCIYADMEARNNALQIPSRCPLTIAAGGGGGGSNARSATTTSAAAPAKRCPGTNLQPVENGSVHTDYQEIKIQEAASRLGVGNIPRSLLIKLQHDLVDTAAPGDEVVVVGSLLAQWEQTPNQALQNDVEYRVGMAMSAHSIRVVAENGGSAWKSSGQNSVGELDKFRKEFEAYWACESNRIRPVAARDFICRAVCPKLYGLQVIKLALLITLIGGVSSDAYEDRDEPGKDASQTQASQPNDGDGAGSGDDQPDAFCVRLLPNRDANSAGADYYGDSIPNHRLRRRPKRRDDQVKTRRRDQSHLLLVGDPGMSSRGIVPFV
jgi:DNA replicative helicase MCM subunit Mcm2 (Cdc46/Mcm family)